MFYDIFMAACENAGIAPTSLLKELGIGKSGASNWKNGMEPTNRIKKQVADYFGVTVSEFMDGKIKKTAILEDDGLVEWAKKLDKALQRYGVDVTKLNEEDVRVIAAMIDAKYNK